MRKTNVSTKTKETYFLKEITQSIDRINHAIKSDQIDLRNIGTPLDLMQIRAENAEAALKSSDIALKALKVLQSNSYEIIKASDIAIVAMKATIKTNDVEAHHKQMVLDELNKVIEKNADNLKASAFALNAVQELAFNDPLTGLPNRRLLKDRLQQCIAHNKRWGTQSAAIFLDLDKFKNLNDQYGHEVGDELLISVANRLKLGVRETDTVARFGGDEFVILLDQLNGKFSDAREQAMRITQKLLSALTPEHELHIKISQDIETTIKFQNFASFGVVIFDGDEIKENNILDWADEAMYWAKSEGGRTIRFYDAIASTEQTLKRLYNLATENDIETANHGVRMQNYVKVLANRALQMNLFPNELNHSIIDKLFRATKLHDIGKTKIPYAILHKKTKLTDEEWSIMKSHTLRGAEILMEAKRQNESLTEFLNISIDIATSHHERWDGNGYPNGLVGNAIPLTVRIIAIADIYDALISRRSYKEPWRHEDVITEISSNAGKQFDPLLIEALIQEQLSFKSIAETTQD